MYKKPKSKMCTAGAVIALAGTFSTVVCSFIEVVVRFKHPELTDIQSMLNFPEIYIAIGVSIVILIVGAIVFKFNQ